MQEIPKHDTNVFMTPPLEEGTLQWQLLTLSPLRTATVLDMPIRTAEKPQLSD